MSIRVLFFASLADVVGKREFELDPQGLRDVGTVFSRFEEQYPTLKAHRPSVLFALNSEFARADAPVSDGDEIAFFPPVSGG